MLFPELPEDQNGLSLSEVRDLISEYRETARKIAAGENETYNALSAEDRKTSLLAAQGVLRDLVEQRDAMEAADKAVAEMAAVADSDTEESPTETEEAPVENEDAGAEAEASTDDAPAAEIVEAPAAPVETPEPVVASGVAPRDAGRAPAPTEAPGAYTITIDGESSDTFDGARFAAAAVEAIDNIQRSTVREGESIRVPVATIKASKARENVLRVKDNAETVFSRIIDAIGTNPLDGGVTRDALTASGGLCAPCETMYEVPVIGSSLRPVRDSLPILPAERGCIRYTTPPDLATAVGGAGVHTVANDTAGDTKSCLTVPCPTTEECNVDAIYQCLTAGNMLQQTYPELIEAYRQLVEITHASLAEAALLSRIDTASIKTTAAASGGAVASIIDHMVTARAGIISRHRMSTESVFRVWAPWWLLDLITVDIYKRPASDADVANLLGQIRDNLNILITPYMDQAAGLPVPQVFGAQADGAPLVPLPPTASWYIAPEGAWVLLDGGEMNMGVVRDSSLNSTNDFQLFNEIFEGTCNLGLETLRVDSEVCAGGTIGAHVDLCAPAGPAPVL